MSPYREDLNDLPTAVGRIYFTASRRSEPIITVEVVVIRNS